MFDTRKQLAVSRDECVSVEIMKCNMAIVALAKRAKFFN